MNKQGVRELLIDVLFRGQKTKAHILVFGDDSSGKQILCLHGLGSIAEESFRELGPLLERNFQVLAVDWIGCGETSRPLGKEDSYSSDYCAEWLREFIFSAVNQKILKSNFSIFAISMSAVAIPKIWDDINSLVDKIIFVNPLGMDRHINKVFAFVLTSPLINHQKIARFFLKGFIWNYIFRWTERDKIRLTKGIQNGEFEVLIRYAKSGILPKGRLMDLNFVPEKFEKIKVPVLLLASSKDHVFYKRDYLEFAKSRENWKVAEISFKNHNLMISKAKDVADEVLKFLK